MKRLRPGLTLILLLCTTAFAQTTTLTVNGTLSLISNSFSGTVTLSGGVSGSGTIAVPAITPGASGYSGNYTITLPSGTLTGVVSVPLSVVTGSGNISLTVTGGTGSYAGASGTFAALTGTAALAGTGVSLTNYTGTGTITLGGTSGGGGGGPTANAPAITNVLDAAGYTKNIAQGSMFVVKGSNLSPSGFTALSYPLPTVSSNGVKITFTPTSGGAGTDAYLINLYNQSGVNQLTAVLPSTLATGNYNVIVTNGSAVSPPFSATVVQRKFSVFTQDTTGTGLAVVQNFSPPAQTDITRFTTGVVNGYTISPAKPGQALIAWGTGLGPISTPDNAAAPVQDFLLNGVDVKVIIGGKSITPFFAGRAPGFSAEDQINFVLPADVQTGCVVPFQVSAGGTLSTTTFIAIAPTPTATECVQPGYTTAQLQNFDLGGSYTVGAFSLTQLQETVPQVGNVKINTIGGGFSRITGFQLSTAAQVQPTPTNGCQVFHINGARSQLSSPITTTKLLDAGNITLTGPTGSNLNNTTITKDTSNSYALSLGFEGAGIPPIPGQVNATLIAGPYALNGAGGPDVGKFNATVNLGAPLTITGGLPTTVVRASDLPLVWTGGNSSDVVSIIGYAGTTSGTGTSATVDASEFICTTTAGAGGFTVQANILNQLPAVTAAQISAGTGLGFLEVVSYNSSTFTAPLTAGGNIDTGVFSSVLGAGATPAFQ